MVAPVNEFDTRLQAESPRTLAPRGGVLLQPSANTVKVAAGVGTPSVITLAATRLNLLGTLAFTTSPSVPLTYNTAGDIAYLHYSDMGTSSVVVTVTLTSGGLTYSDSKTIALIALSDLGFTGDPAATRGAPAGTPVGATDAATVESNAANAIAAIAVISDDGKLSKGEKPQVILDWNAILGEKSGIDTQADNLSVSRTAYDNAYSALYTYLTGLVPSYTDTTTDTTIDGPTFRSKFTDYYSARQALANAIAAKTATLSTWAGTASRPVDFRVIAEGGASTAAPATPGFYQQGTSLLAAVRSYNVAIIRRSDGVMYDHNTFDVYGGGSTTGGRDGGTMAGMLNSYGSAYVAVVWTYDEPYSNRTLGGLDTALYRCGASRAVFGGPQFKYKGAYILVGVCGCGEGNGNEAYSGATDSDTNAWCDVAFSLLGGNIVGTSGTYIPNSSYGAPAGTPVGSTDAATVESNAAAGKTASDAAANKPVVSLDMSSVSTSKANPTSSGSLVSFGSAAASYTGGNGTVTLTWTLTISDTSPSGLTSRIITTLTGSSCALAVSVPNDTSVVYTLSVTATDSKGYASTLSSTKNIQIGTAR